MPEIESQDPKKASSIGVIFFTGVVSLLVGVSTAWIIDYLKSRSAKLEYQIISSTSFIGSAQKLAFVSVEIANSGSRDLDSITAKIEWQGGELAEARFEGLPTKGLTEVKTLDSFSLDVPFLNPGESGKVFLLIKLSAQNFNKPSITLRARGISGVDREAKKKGQSTWDVPLAASLGTILAYAFIRKNQRGGFFGKFTSAHSDDQRDVAAYVLDLHGLHELAFEIRTLTRDISYWSIADHVTARVVRQNNPELSRRAAMAIRTLLDYASIAETTVMLINFDHAKLLAHAGDTDDAKQALAKARSEKHPVIEKRVSYDPLLSKLADM